MKLPKLLIDIAFVYHALFMLMGLLGITGAIDSIVLNQNTQELLWIIFKYGYILYWIFWLTILTRLAGWLKFDRARLIVMITLVVLTTVEYLITYRVQF